MISPTIRKNGARRVTFIGLLLIVKREMAAKRCTQLKRHRMTASLTPRRKQPDYF
jgi:hypothetical protein